MTTKSKAAPLEVINVRFGSLLPWPFHFMAVVAVLIAMVIAFEHPWTAVAFVVCGLFVFTSAEGTEIDLVNRRFREYTSFFFFRTGQWVDYECVEKLYVNKNKMRQKGVTYRTGHTRTYTFDEFSAFVKFSEEEIVQLVKHKDKDLVMKRAKAWSQRMNIPLYDNTVEQLYDNTDDTFLQ